MRVRAALAASVMAVAVVAAPPAAAAPVTPRAHLDEHLNVSGVVATPGECGGS
jgi:hypothetical protein